MYGSVTASTSDDELYLIGACDNSHSLSFDLKICSRSGEVSDYVVLNSAKEYQLTPCIQSCFAYTTAVKNNGEWVTVRRLRVLTHALTLTDDVESLTSSLDSEVLAVVSHFLN